MSAATLDEYTSAKEKYSAGKLQPANSNQTISTDTVFAERARILETVARKAQEKTLTLQETTDLYARFNQTYERTYLKKAVPQEDESWALKLLEECAQETDLENALQTRINGEPLKQKPIKLAKSTQASQTRIRKPASKHTLQSRSVLTLNQALFEEELKPEVLHEEKEDKPKLKLREAFIYEQLNFSEEQTKYSARSHTNRRFWIILGICGTLTCAALVGISQLM